MKQTGIQSAEELKQHILNIQREAWNVVHYACIRRFGFTKLRIKLLPGYPTLLQLAKEKPDAVLLDFACAFGVDTRAAIADGYPVNNVVATDLQQDFWDIGHKLFKSTPQSFPVPFVQGNVFDPKHIAPAAPLYEPPNTPRPHLPTLSSLIPLRGHVSAIHVAAFFHLFQEEGQLQAARALASLLSPEKGSFIFGSHSALPEKGIRKHPNPRGEYIYCHDVDSWHALWDSMVFEKGTVKVTSVLNERPLRPSETDKRYTMLWTVTRI